MARVPSTSRVIVIGAGYAGVRAAKAARRHGADVLLLDHDGRHHFGPRLASVAAGAADEGDAAADVESLLGIPVQVADVRKVDLAGRRVLLRSGTVHPYDAVVVATGSAPARPPIDGLEEHALDLRTADDAVRLRQRLRSTNRLVVIGGGTTGVQLAAEVAAERRGLSVDLVEAGPRLLPTLGATLASHAADLLRQRGVRIHLAAPVESVTASGAVLADGTRLPGLVVWCGGFTPNGHELLPDAPVAEDGRLRVTDTLQLEGHPEVFVAGDAAEHVDLLGRHLDMSAQVAVQGGKAAGRNAALVATGRKPIAALLLDLGRVVHLGGGRGLAAIGPLRLGPLGTDRLVPLLHEAIDIRHLLETGGLRALVRHGRGQNRRRTRPDGRPDLRVLDGSA